MGEKTFFASLTRIADLEKVPYRIQALDRDEWETGDYVLGTIDREPVAGAMLELPSGRLLAPQVGDQVVGALGFRFATLGITGDWQAVEADMRMEMMTAAGLIGRARSRHVNYPSPLSLTYRGHLNRGGRKLTMSAFVPQCPMRDFDMPTVLLVGSSMSAGKTTSARVIIRTLKEMGLAVIGAKFTGAGRYRDIQSMEDAGADRIYDFVDAGLPSTVHPEGDFRARMQHLLCRISEEGGDVLVAEAGASPLEPYNGAAAIEILSPHVRAMVLCASDPYSVVGVQNAFGKPPDLVAGIAASTDAGVALIERLAQIPALNLVDSSHRKELRQFLLDRLE
ncbi:MAG: hypothetical protein KDH88_03620 [Chromatiales bacterium]|nr:hypothetical protein [Chromatiales bacterium]